MLMQASADRNPTKRAQLISNMKAPRAPPVKVAAVIANAVVALVVSSHNSSPNRRNSRARPKPNARHNRTARDKVNARAKAQAKAARSNAIPLAATAGRAETERLSSYPRIASR
jgi:hypothetical protein